MAKRKKVSIGKVLSTIFLLFVVVVTLFPILYVIVGSLKTNRELLTAVDKFFPQNPTFDNFKLAWNSDSFKVPMMLKNSLLLTVWSVFTSVLVSSTTGYVFARGNFPGKKIIFASFISLMFVNLGGISIYATFDVLNFLGMPRSLYSYMFTTLFGVPVTNMYLVRGYVQTLPAEINEAAMIDGASFPMIYFKIVMPLLIPIMATIAMLAFQGSWNDYVLPTIFTVTKPEQQTLMVGLMALKSSSGAATSWNLMLAGSAIAMAPVLVFYLFANKYIIEGMSAGAVKG